MKKSISTFYISCLFFLFNFMAFAVPGSESDTENLQDQDAPAAPIDNYLWVLLLLGILFVVLKYRNNQKTSLNK